MAICEKNYYKITYISHKHNYVWNLWEILELPYGNVIDIYNYTNILSIDCIGLWKSNDLLVCHGNPAIQVTKSWTQKCTNSTLDQFPPKYQGKHFLIQILYTYLVSRHRYEGFSAQSSDSMTRPTFIFTFRIFVKGLFSHMKLTPFWDAWNPP